MSVPVIDKSGIKKPKPISKAKSQQKKTNLEGVGTFLTS